MLKIGQNWGKIANYPRQCSTKIGTSTKEKLIVHPLLSTIAIKKIYFHKMSAYYCHQTKSIGFAAAVA